jgi:hypothetical protein
MLSICDRLLKKREKNNRNREITDGMKKRKSTDLILTSGIISW